MILSDWLGLDIRVHSNTWVKAALLQLLNKPNNHGGFTSTSRCDISNNDHWYIAVTTGASPLLLVYFDRRASTPYSQDSGSISSGQRAPLYQAALSADADRDA